MFNKNYCLAHKYLELSNQSCINNIWGKVFKNGLSKICGRQPLKNFTGWILEYLDPYIHVMNPPEIKEGWWIRNRYISWKVDIFLNYRGVSFRGGYNIYDERSGLQKKGIGSKDSSNLVSLQQLQSMKIFHLGYGSSCFLGFFWNRIQNSPAAFCYPL